MRRDVRREALRFLAGVVDSSADSDGLWQRIEKLLGREETPEESAEVGALFRTEAQKLRARAERSDP